MYSKKLEKFSADTLAILKLARTPRAFSKTIQRIANDLGFSHFDITHVNSDGKMDIVLTNLPDSLIDSYFSEQYDDDCVARAYSTSENTHLFYTDLHNHFSTNPFSMYKVPRVIAAYQLITSYGYHDAYTTYPVVNAGRDDRLMFTVYAANEQPCGFKRLVHATEAQITTLTNTACHLLCNRFGDTVKEENFCHLNTKQIEILEAMGRHSMTQQQAADYAGLTESTVKTYCKHIKEKLGKRTISGAIYEALKLGIIAVDRGNNL